MTYQEILTYLYGLGRFGMKPGLDNIRAILRSLSDPQDSLQVIHVAGTNGKGSTSSFLSSILCEGGYKPGLFTSPHLISFTERIRIKGVEIKESEAFSVAERVIAVAPSVATFFEIVTAMAFLYFAEQGAGPVILETGMGGRLDATNASSKIMSVITPISLDHCDYLGEDIPEIAREKAGIIMSGIPVVVSVQPKPALEVIRETCAVRNSPMYSFGGDFFASWEGAGLSYRGLDWNMEELRPGIGGRYQSSNAATALCASELLVRQGFALDAETARAGLEKAFWPGRMEIIGTSPKILLDGAHNPAGAAALAEALSDVPRDRLIMIVGLMSNKDIEGMLALLAPLADRVLTVSPAMPRSFSSSELAGKFRAAGACAEDAGSVSAGLDLAIGEAGPADLILVCGSLFTVGEARAVLLSRNFEPCRG
jgi:dihydrofolate synthase/folylpolyglutamate synthase